MSSNLSVSEHCLVRSKHDLSRDSVVSFFQRAADERDVRWDVYYSRIRHHGNCEVVPEKKTQYRRFLYYYRRFYCYSVSVQIILYPLGETMCPKGPKRRW